MLSTVGVSLVRNQRCLLSDISLEFHPGRFTAILGPNGAGKSTLLSALAGLSPINDGQRFLHAKPLEDFNIRALSRCRAMLAQSTALSFPFSVEDVAGMGLEPFPEWRSQASRKIRDQLAALELSDFAHRSYPSLSGGEQQRVQLARALLQWRAAHMLGDTPAVLLLDEPTSAMDLRQQLLALQQARKAARDGGIVIAVLHDINLASQFADHWVLMQAGRVYCEGPVTEVCKEDILNTVFDVKSRCRVDSELGRVTVALENVS